VGVFSRHEGTFDLFVSPKLYGTPLHETVMDEYVAWAEARAREAGPKQLADGAAKTAHRCHRACTEIWPKKCLDKLSHYNLSPNTIL
jgi:hypothetical protein